MTPDELTKVAQGLRGAPERLGVVSASDMLDVVAEARGRGQRVVMTNGCFDLLHPGHIAYLEQAATLGDMLLVAVNDDDSVRRLKGDARPVNAIADRMAVLVGLAAHLDHARLPARLDRNAPGPWAADRAAGLLR